MTLFPGTPGERRSYHAAGSAADVAPGPEVASWVAQRIREETRVARAIVLEPDEDGAYTYPDP